MRPHSSIIYHVDNHKSNLQTYLTHASVSWHSISTYGFIKWNSKWPCIQNDSIWHDHIFVRQSDRKPGSRPSTKISVKAKIYLTFYIMVWIWKTKHDVIYIFKLNNWKIKGWIRTSLSFVDVSYQRFYVCPIPIDNCIWWSASAYYFVMHRTECDCQSQLRQFVDTCIQYFFK